MKLDCNRVFTGLILAALLTRAAPPASAQIVSADDPFSSQTTDQATDDNVDGADVTLGTTGDTTAIDPRDYGPAIQAILERERSTPEQLLEGILLLVDFDEPELAKPWLDQLVAANPDVDTKAALARRFGSHRLLRLASADALGTPARETAMSYLDAFASQVRDPARLAGLIEQLADPSIDAQYTAISGLVEAGEAGAVALVAALDAAASDRHREAMQVALAELAPLSFGPLLAGLSSEGTDAADVRAASARVLSRVAPPHMAVWLLGTSQDDDPDAQQARQYAAQGLQRMTGSVPTKELAERLLQQFISRYLEAATPLDVDENGQVDVWYWDETHHSPTAIQLDPADARVHYASSLADDLLKLRPANVEHQKQATMLRLAAPNTELRLSDLSLPVDAAAARGILLGAMQMAMDKELPRAMAAGARALRFLPPDEGVLLANAPAESPLVAALTHPDRGVRWEALATIMAIDPVNPYPGSSRLMQCLTGFIEMGSRPRAVVAMPGLDKAQTLAANVASAGYEVTHATTGRDALRAAAEEGGAELVLVDARIERPLLREVLYQLRAHPASSAALVGVVGVGEGLKHGRSVAQDHETATAFPYPQDAEDVAAIVERLQQSAAGGTAVVDLPERGAMSRQALAWFGQVVAHDGTFYDAHNYEPIVLRATANPDLATLGVAILASFPSYESQNMLVDVASNRLRPIELREAAAEAFRQSVERYGVQLAAGDVYAQYDRYNESETADRPTQIVLAHVLDTIEAGKDRRTAGR